MARMPLREALKKATKGSTRLYFNITKAQRKASKKSAQMARNVRLTKPKPKKSGKGIRKN